ncbi:SDR family oxidoreductase [Thiomonas sp.]|jgi:dTDP-4-dehydrorhamnose reductase|uniref:dTDP-4-dehydrorhamnose reductase family protein n=1 Tax=Thiomonas sp. TaxID=2047785 RepID=UPI0026279534|nr:SDR family oxidoreductase [Thiomonas sp.]
MRILLFGASGLLGSFLAPYLAQAGHEVIAFRRRSDVPSDAPGLEMQFADAIGQARAQAIVNLIALTQVDACEDDLAKASLLNAQVPEMLSRHAAGAPGCFVLHISTDHLYGTPGPHPEEDFHPLNVYALTKYHGEFPVLERGGCVLRTNFFGRSRAAARASLSDWILNEVAKGAPVPVFDDVRFSPLGLHSLSRTIEAVLARRLAGLFNAGSAQQGVSKAEFAALLCGHLGLVDARLEPRSIERLALRAPRPRDMRMRSARLADALAWPIPDIHEEIEHEYPATH